MTEIFYLFVYKLPLGIIIIMSGCVGLFLFNLGREIWRDIVRNDEDSEEKK